MENGHIDWYSENHQEPTKAYSGIVGNWAVLNLILKRKETYGTNGL